MIARPDGFFVKDAEGCPAAWLATRANSQVWDRPGVDGMDWKMADAQGHDLWYAMLGGHEPPSEAVVKELRRHHAPQLPPSGKGWLATFPHLFPRLATLPQAIWEGHATAMWSGSSEEMEALGRYLWDAPWVEGSEPHVMLHAHMRDLHATGRLSDLPNSLRQWWGAWSLASLSNEPDALDAFRLLNVSAKALLDQVTEGAGARSSCSFASAEHAHYGRLCARLRQLAALEVAPSSPRSSRPRPRS